MRITVNDEKPNYILYKTWNIPISDLKYKKALFYWFTFEFRHNFLGPHIDLVSDFKKNVNDVELKDLGLAHKLFIFASLIHQPYQML